MLFIRISFHILLFWFFYCILYLVDAALKLLIQHLLFFYYVNYCIVSNKPIKHASFHEISTYAVYSYRNSIKNINGYKSLMIVRMMVIINLKIKKEYPYYIIHVLWKDFLFFMIAKIDNLMHSFIQYKKILDNS